ncbi:insulin-degrading enzyme-like [Rhopalosiphum padi]|uniref:insulin-degrading enzyme-like n=1 Tax=Rhopalosiphum padi TaxID=40932 RepID=UPI00298E7C57|nr:insulin-degrading enzyme-like [Rhopalosiphum padi]
MPGAPLNSFHPIIILNGFDHKIHGLLKKTIEALLTFRIHPRRLELNKKEKIRDQNNIEKVQPYYRAMQYTEMILTDIAWSPSEIINSIQDIDVDSYRDVMNKFWSHLHMESLMYGNIDKSMAQNLVRELEKPFLSNRNFRPVSLQEMIRIREVEINDGENLVYEKTTAFHNNSAVVFNLQCGIQNTKDNMVVSLFNEIIEESCFNVLRTQVKAV